MARDLVSSHGWNSISSQGKGMSEDADTSPKYMRLAINGSVSALQTFDRSA
jgi:hypothetical protein